MEIGKMEKANEKLILHEIKNISSRQNDLNDLCKATLDLVRNQPSKSEVELMIMNHYKSCDARTGLAEVTKQSSENTGIIKTLQKHRVSFAPRKSDPPYIKIAKILIPAIVTLFGGGAVANHFLGFFQ